MCVYIYIIYVCMYVLLYILCMLYTFKECLSCRILQQFGVSAQEYHVIFTSGATAALQMVAQTFCFTDHQNNNEKTATDEGGCFFYLVDNHTSVLGIRQVVNSRGCNGQCVTCDEVESLLTSPDTSRHHHGNSLFAFPAQSNFSGQKYPLSWIDRARTSLSNELSKCYVLLDAAGLVATSPLDLGPYQPDFVCLSFYKMFGFPTGLGNDFYIHLHLEASTKTCY